MPARKKSSAPEFHGLQRIRIENEGLEVFLYDDAERSRLKRAAADFFNTARSEAKGLAALKRLAEEGALVVYELPQDDALDVAVRVGPPLDAHEREGATWRPAQHALLHLPSGTLCIESSNSCRINPYEAPMARGAKLKLPPGRYRLTLERVDGDATSERYAGPREVLTLQPTGVERGPGAPSLLTVTGEVPVPAPLRGEVSEGHWQGTVHRVEEGKLGPLVHLDLGEAETEELGWLYGERLALETPPLRAPVFLVGGPYVALRYRMFVGQEELVRLVGPEGLEAAFTQLPSYREPIEGRRDWLSLSSVSEAPAVQARLRELVPGTRVTLRAEPPPYERAARPPKARRTAEGLEGVVIGSSAHRLSLNFDYKLLASAGLAEKNTWAELQVAGERFRIAQKDRRFEETAAQTPEENRERLRELGERSFEIRDREALEALSAEYDALYFGPGVLAARPLAWQVEAHWVLGDEARFLALEPFFAPRARANVYGVPRFALGTPVRLRKL